MGIIYELIDCHPMAAIGWRILYPFFKLYKQCQHDVYGASIYDFLAKISETNNFQSMSIDIAINLFYNHPNIKTNKLLNNQMIYILIDEIMKLNKISRDVQIPIGYQDKSKNEPYTNVDYVLSGIMHIIEIIIVIIQKYHIHPTINLLYLLFQV